MWRVLNLYDIIFIILHFILIQVFFIFFSGYLHFFFRLVAVLLLVLCASYLSLKQYLFSAFLNNSCGQSIVMHSLQTILWYLSKKIIPCNFCRWKHSLYIFSLLFVPQTLEKENNPKKCFPFTHHLPLNLPNIPFDDSINSLPFAFRLSYF